MQVEGFNHVTVNISNLANSLNFYTRILGLQLVHRGKTDAYLEWEVPGYVFLKSLIIWRLQIKGSG
ncbi:Metallothiol transferase FosB [compost metagenome]